jgi:hypothetical protein
MILKASSTSSSKNERKHRTPPTIIYVSASRSLRLAKKERNQRAKQNFPTTKQATILQIINQVEIYILKFLVQFAAVVLCDNLIIVSQ